MKNLILILSVLFTFSSCSFLVNPVHYLGNDLPPTDHVDIFFNFGDVEKEFTVIGKLSNDAGATYSIEKVKQKMVAKAREKGGDAIVFLNLDVESYDASRRIAIAAEVLRYKDK